MNFRRTSLSQQGRIRVLCFCVLAFFVLGGFTAQGWKKAHDLERFLEYSYQHSFIELVTSVESVDTALQKGLYATSPLLVSQLAGDICREAATAQTVMGRLPFASGMIDNTSQFLSRVSDYAASLSRKAAAGMALDVADRDTLRSLSSVAHTLAAEMAYLQAVVTEQDLRVGSIAEAELRAEQESQEGEDGAYSPFSSSFRNMENSFNNLPTLIYDGPFSVHLEQKMPAALNGQPEISMEDARKKALSILGLPEGHLSFARVTDGKIPAYSFIGHLNGGEITVDITKYGGLPLSMLDTRSQNGTALSVEDCVTKAQEFLRRCGYEDMETSYWIDTGVSLLVNFAYAKDGVVCYPDLIKVGIARDTGEVVQFEAKGYIMNHISNRSAPAPTVSAEDARQGALTPDLTFEAAKLCLIPSPGGDERLCHELTCLTSDGAHVLIYVNAQTGLEEQILLLIEDENGTLAV